MAVLSIISNRAVSGCAAAWCIGFAMALTGAFLHHDWIKIAGSVLLAPFSVYVAVMLVLSTIAFIRSVKNSRKGRMDERR